MLLENHLARGIQSKSLRGLGAEPPVGGLGGQAPYKNGGFGGRDHPNIKKILSFSTKSTLSQKLKIAKIGKLFLSFGSAHCAGFIYI